MIKRLLIVTLILLGSKKIKSAIVISFGQSCTVAGAMRDCGIRREAYPFDWVVSPFDAIYKAINDDFIHFLQEDSLTVRSDNWGILDYYGFQFVHDFPSILPNDEQANLIGENHVTGGTLRDDWKNFIHPVQTKYQRRIERLKKILSGTDKVYIIRHHDTTKEQAVRIRDLLN